MIRPDGGTLFGAKERKKLSRHENMWKNLKYILLSESERSQSEKFAYC